uniref:Uncharacterized protein n=1 Tax=Anas platyrhynchos platyrhynchos TaxID=8840 RepID=A0A493TC22_ANAPP
TEPPPWLYPSLRGNPGLRTEQAHAPWPRTPLHPRQPGGFTRNFYKQWAEAPSGLPPAGGLSSGCRGSTVRLPIFRPGWRARLPRQPLARSVAPTSGLSLFRADLMKPSLQMKHNFKDRRVVGRSGDDVCLFLLVSSCLFNYRRC